MYAHDKKFYHPRFRYVYFLIRAFPFLFPSLNGFWAYMKLPISIKRSLIMDKSKIKPFWISRNKLRSYKIVKLDIKYFEYFFFFTCVVSILETLPLVAVVLCKFPFYPFQAFTSHQVRDVKLLSAVYQCQFLTDFMVPKKID